MLIEQIVELRGPGPPGRICTDNCLFSSQNNNLYGQFLSGLLFTAKILHEAMYFTSPYLDQFTYKI